MPVSSSGQSILIYYADGKDNGRVEESKYEQKQQILIST